MLGGYEGTLTLPQIAALWRAVETTEIITHNGSRRNWSAARGPIGALWLSLHRLGWSMNGHFTLVDHDQEDIMLTTISPALLAVMLQRAAMRALQLKVAEKMAVTDGNFAGRRVAADHVAAQLKRDRRPNAKDRACYMAVACGAVMTHSRAVAEGYLVDDRCPLCGACGDTILHRIWRCQQAPRGGASAGSRRSSMAHPRVREVDGRGDQRLLDDCTHTAPRRHVASAGGRGPHGLRVGGERAGHRR